MLTKERIANYMRNVVFGIEDSLVSTVGLLSGIAVVGTDEKTIVLAGVVLIFVEAFSMGVGSLLSDHSVQQFETGVEVAIERSVLPGIAMFFSYFLAGFVPLAPYMFLGPETAFSVSIGASLVALFLLGAASARYANTNTVRLGFEMLILGGLAIGLGVVVGMLVNGFS